ncbi:hypothetical protein NDK25_07390 [Niallia taxi]|nr:hypothetical protein [Niallia taxi]MDE5052240.1 hypothetical protein [Niallia taxi]
MKRDRFPASLHGEQNLRGTHNAVQDGLRAGRRGVGNLSTACKTCADWQPLVPLQLEN